jgi:hypothetical protein
MLEKTEWEINNEQSRETSNIGPDTRRKTKQKTTEKKHTTICCGHYYTPTITNNVNKT